MGMASTHNGCTDAPCDGQHVCRYAWPKRVSPAGGNRREISVIVVECMCGRLLAKYPENLTYWERRWIQRVNNRIAGKPTDTAERQHANDY